MAATSIVEQDLGGGLRRLVASGARDRLFRDLGEYAATDIAAVLDSMPERAGLGRFHATPQGRSTVERIIGLTRRAYPAESRELDDIARGAGRDELDVWLANLRGDLGGSDGTGCTDLAWRGRGSFVAHNEDGAPGLAGRYRLLTLLVDGEVPVTTGWYPGFLPANAHCVTGHGLAWGIDHIQVPRPADAPGRHFVARAAQHLRTLAAVVGHLRTRPAAGGFTYTIGERGGDVVTVETAAGRCASHAPSAAEPLVWHTNHLRWLAAPAAPDAGDLGGAVESRARAAVLGSLGRPAADPDLGWFRRVLVDRAVPDGVHRTAAGTDPLTTLCTTVVDLTRADVTVIAPDGTTHTVSWDDTLRRQAWSV